MRKLLAAIAALMTASAFPGSALAQEASGPITTDKFSIDAEGMITLEDDFVDEMFCILDTVEPETVEAAGEALAVGAWPADVDGDFQLSRDVCADDYDWSDREGQLAIITSSTQSLINHALALIEAAGISYDDVIEVHGALSEAQSVKFSDGSWLNDAAMIAALDSDLRAHGLTDRNLIAMGEMAVGAYANQVGAIQSWVELLVPE